MTSNKAGHDYPTGPLDMIQSWVELRVTDSNGRLIFTSDQRDERNFLVPGTFLFKAEPVEQYGNLIDRHNYLANCYADLGNILSTIAELDALPRINPQNHRAFQRKGELLAARATSRSQLALAR